ncbi:MAG: hypothetical protein J7K58_05695 [Euryarchaeota archaeon]|nr:hypothetical protein [Euryarchaeota archaeon]
MFRRQVAWRVFIEEVKRSRYIHEEEMDDKTIRYLVSPFGALINRVFFVGTVTDVIESKERRSIKARISDITGVISIYAGEFQPDVYTFLKLLENEPTIVMLTAKIRIFEPEEGRKIPIIRPEWIKKAKLSDRNAWIIDVASNTIERLNYVRKIAENFDNDLTEDMLIELQVPFHYWKPLKLTFTYYTPEEILKEVEDYKALLTDSLGYISDIMKFELEEFGIETEEEPEVEEEVETPKEEYELEEAYEEAPSSLEKVIIDTIKEMDSGAGAPWSGVIDRVHKITGVSKEIIEEVIEDLLTRAEIYEVSRGRLKAF